MMKTIRSLNDAVAYVLEVTKRQGFTAMDSKDIPYGAQYRFMKDSDVVVVSIYYGKSGFKTVMGGKDSPAKATLERSLTGTPQLIAKPATHTLSDEAVYGEYRSDDLEELPKSMLIQMIHHLEAALVAHSVQKVTPSKYPQHDNLPY